MNLPIIKDFPKSGVNFIDIFPLFQPPQSRLLLHDLSDVISRYPGSVAIPEARAFLLGGMISAIDGRFLIPFRKPHKLPGLVSSIEYQSEYATTSLEYRASDFSRAFSYSPSVIIVDDVLATGNTALALASALETYGFTISAFIFLAQVSTLPGVSKLQSIAPVHVLYS